MMRKNSKSVKRKLKLQKNTDYMSTTKRFLAKEVNLKSSRKTRECKNTISSKRSRSWERMKNRNASSTKKQRKPSWRICSKKTWRITRGKWPKAPLVRTSKWWRSRCFSPN